MSSTMIRDVKIISILYSSGSLAVYNIQPNLCQNELWNDDRKSRLMAS